MASTNQSPQYQKAEANFLAAKTDEDKIYWLEEMIREAPKHKSAEAMLANLKTRRKKFLEKIEIGKKKGKTTKQGIKKEEMQAVIVGFTNSGKSSLLASLTHATPEIASYEFTTKQPIVGMMPFSGTQIQIIEIPAVGSEFYDRGLVNSADVVLILVTEIAQIEKILRELTKARGEKIIVFNNKENLDERKLESTLKSRKYNFIIINTEKLVGNKDNDGRVNSEKGYVNIKNSVGGAGGQDSFDKLNELKEKIFLGFHKIRVFTKEPNKGKSEKPLILHQGATIRDVAEKIRHGFSSFVKESFVTGPSSKFPNQKVSLKHELKDLDVVEFKTK